MRAWSFEKYIYFSLAFRFCFGNEAGIFSILWKVFFFLHPRSEIGSERLIFRQFEIFLKNACFEYLCKKIKSKICQNLEFSAEKNLSLKLLIGFSEKKFHIKSHSFRRQPQFNRPLRRPTYRIEFPLDFLTGILYMCVGTDVCVSMHPRESTLLRTYITPGPF